MNDIDKLVRKNVRDLIPYSCARDEFQGKGGIFLDANENPYGNLNRYPDPYQRELKSAISKLKGIPEENIFLGNGSDEIIDLTYRIFCNPCSDKALTFTPTYGMYEVSAGINDIELIRVPLTDGFQIDTDSVKQFLSDPSLKLVIICSPNNPTGNSMINSDIETILMNFGGIVLIDEAYMDFSDKESFKRLINRYPNLIVMQTFSKALGLAAARIGMAFTNQAVVQYFNKMKPPYNISTINQKAAIEKLTMIEEYHYQVNKIKAERVRLSVVLSKMPFVEEVYPSDANFILVRTINADAAYKYLVDNNIIIRNRNRVVPGCIRITVGTEDENKKLEEALNKFAL